MQPGQRIGLRHLEQLEALFSQLPQRLGVRFVLQGFVSAIGHVKVVSHRTDRPILLVAHRLARDFDPQGRLAFERERDLKHRALSIASSAHAPKRVPERLLVVGRHEAELHSLGVEPVHDQHIVLEAAQTCEYTIHKLAAREHQAIAVDVPVPALDAGLIQNPLQLSLGEPQLLLLVLHRRHIGDQTQRHTLKGLEAHAASLNVHPDVLAPGKARSIHNRQALASIDLVDNLVDQAPAPVSARKVQLAANDILVLLGREPVLLRRTARHHVHADVLFVGP